MEPPSSPDAGTALLPPRTAEAGLDPQLAAVERAPAEPEVGAETIRVLDEFDHALGRAPSAVPRPSAAAQPTTLLSRRHWPPQTVTIPGLWLRASGGALTGEPNQAGAGLARRFDRHPPLKEDSNGKGRNRRGAA